MIKQLNRVRIVMFVAQERHITQSAPFLPPFLHIGECSKGFAVLAQRATLVRAHNKRTNLFQNDL
jgi:hypothetical protein